MILEHKLIPRKNPSSRGRQPRITVMQCDVCHTTFERPYSKLFFQMTIHRCSTKCTYGSRSTDGLGGHGAELVTLSCPICEKQMTHRMAGSERKWAKCCSQKCYGEFRRRNPGLWQESTLESLHALDVKQRAKEANRARRELPDYVHPMLGKHHNDETKQKISQHHIETSCLVGEKNGMFGKHHTDHARAAMSEKHAQLIVDGKMKPYGKNNHCSGHHVSPKLVTAVFFRSSWEEALFKHLDVSATVKTYAVEPIKISYTYNNNRRWYVPDVLVEYVDGSKRLFEVKPAEFVNNEKTRLKSAAAIEWCKQNNVQSYEILTKQDLINMGCIL